MTITETTTDIATVYRNAVRIEDRLSSTLRSDLTPLGQRVVDALCHLIEVEAEYGEVWYVDMISGNDIAKHLNIKPQAVGGAIARLAELGILQTVFRDGDTFSMNKGICQTYNTWRATSTWMDRWTDCFGGGMIQDWVEGHVGKAGGGGFPDNFEEGHALEEYAKSLKK